MHLRALLFLLLILSCFPLQAAAQRDSLQAHVLISAMTYEDGFGVPLKDPAGIFYQRKSKEIFVADAGNGRVVVFDTLLSALYTFKHYVKESATGERVLGEPRGMAVNDDGEILLLDARSSTLDLLDFRGKLITNINAAQLLGDSTTRIVFSGVTIDTNGRFYLLVSGDVAKVFVLDRDLQVVRSFGESGNLPEQFMTPSSICFANGLLAIGDLRALPAVKIFDTLGNFLNGFGGHDIQLADISLPSGIAELDCQLTGRVFIVADGLRHVLKLFDDNRQVVTMIGGFGYEPGLLQYPSGIASDGVATFYVVERAAGRVQRYDLR